MARIRVLIVDDHRLFADVMFRALLSHGPYSVEIATNGAEALDAARRHKPELVLLDMNLPDQDGLAIGRTILEELDHTRVVAVSSSSDPRLAARAIRAGFQGYISKETNVVQFVDSLRAVLAGDVVVVRHLGLKVARPRSGRADSQSAVVIGQLTPREREVLGLLGDGLSTTAIAHRLSIRPNTVRTHVQNVLAKLQVHSRLEAAALASRHGLGDVA
jgi:two-component system, NarL family, nitrate/nitrite response regulator NarL